MKICRALTGVILILLTGTVGASTTFGDPDTSAVPNVTEISVYDVTGATDKGTGGSVEDSGLNTTLVLEQGSARQYRFTFKVRNDGSKDWEVTSADPMRHEGLNESWSVNQIYYNHSSKIYGETDGSFTSGTVSWSTASGPVVAPGEVLWAKYIVKIDQNRSSVFEQNFKVNDTVNNTGSIDKHDLDLQKYGKLQMSILEPPKDSVVVQNQNFTLNGSATCVDGKCDSVNLTARYNTSSRADTEIPGTGTPFETENKNSQNCANQLSRGETCYTTWQVNSTGDLETYHLLDVQGSSNSSYVQRNDSSDRKVQINTAVIIDLNWSSIGFGTLSPGETSPAAQNSEGYNITVDSRSEPVNDLSVRGTDLVSQIFPEEYSIGEGNITISGTESRSDGFNLTESYQVLTSGLSPGSTFSTRYWIDIPKGVYKGDYEGKIYFRADTTQ